jgi:hypothetical protein
VSFTNYAAQAVLNSYFGKTSNFGTLASRPTLHVGLSTTTPAEGGTGITEPSTGGYAREATAPADWNVATLADPSVVTNLNVIDFGTATGTWASGANMTHFVLFDAPTGGNALFVGALVTPMPVFNTNPVSFAAGTLTVTLD